MSLLIYEQFMKSALCQADLAYKEDEVPIGAVLVIDNNIIAENHNRNRQLIDPTAHAEILVLREAAQKIGEFRLNNAELYVTVEPCPMCAGAIIYSRIKKVIYGCKDAKAGCHTSVLNILNNKKFNHRVETISGILEKESLELLQNFFKEKRQKKKK